MDDDRYDFEEYVNKQIKLLEDGNAADNRPTYEAEITALKERCERLYVAGQTLITSFSQTELDHCQQVFEIQESTKKFDEQQRPDDFCEIYVDRKTIIARRYLSAFPVTRKLSKVLT